MSRQSSQHPDVNQETPSSKSKKDKPWRLWEKWPAVMGTKRNGWFLFGRYRTREEAEKVMALEQRRWRRSDEVERPRNPGSHSAHLTRPFRYWPEEFRVLHESQGRPQ